MSPCERPRAGRHEQVDKIPIHMLELRTGCLQLCRSLNGLQPLKCNDCSTLSRGLWHTHNRDIRTCTIATMPFVSSTVSLALAYPISNTMGASLFTVPQHLSQAHCTAPLQLSSSATMSTENCVSLDWRSAPSSSEIVKQIEKLFTTLDQEGTVSLCLSNTKAKDAVSLIEQGGQAMIRRKDNQVSQPTSFPALRGMSHGHVDCPLLCAIHDIATSLADTTHLYASLFPLLRC